jgi:hypothetical protein
VAQLAAAAFRSDQPGDGTFDYRAVLPVGMAELGVVDPVSAGLAQQGVAGVQVQGSTGLAGGASLAQRATSAGGSERDGSTWGDSCELLAQAVMGDRAVDTWGSDRSISTPPGVG